MSNIAQGAKSANLCSTNSVEQLMARLYDELESAARLYYNGLPNQMNDATYDNKYDYLCSLELAHPEFIRHGSITETVGAKPLNSLPVVRYEKPALSLDKRYDIDEITDYFVGNNVQSLNASVKCDGLTVLFEYEPFEDNSNELEPRKGSRLVLASSRGQGLEGNDLTRQAMYLPDTDIPKEIPYHGGKVVVRAEVMLPKAMLPIINSQLPEDVEPYKSCRNLASGTIRNLDPTLTAKRGLIARTFEVVTCDGMDFKTHTEALRWAAEQGFCCVQNKAVGSNDVGAYMRNIVESRDALEFDIDGLVFVTDDLSLQSMLPGTSKYQGGKLAFKFPNKGQTTTVTGIQWQIGSTRKLTPVLNVEAVEFDGATVINCTAHNLAYVLGERESGEVAPAISIGSQIRLERAGEVIPKCGEVFFTENCQPVEYPSVCPVCGAPTARVGVDLICTNEDCKGALKEQIEVFASKPCMNIKGLGEKTVSALVDMGFITKFQDILFIKKHRAELLNVDGFGVKTLNELERQLDSCKTVELASVIASLPIKGIGLSVGRILAARFNTLLDFMSFKGDYSELDGIGCVMNNAIHQFIDSKKGISILFAYLYFEIGNVNTSNVTPKGNKLEDMTFVITGTLSRERDYFKNLILENGGKVVGSVSSKTTYLLAGENVGATKLNKATSVGVAIINEDDFFALLNE